MTNTGSCWLKGSQLIIGFIVITGCLVTPSGFCSECKVLCVSPVFTVLSTLPRDPLKKKEGKEKGGGKKKVFAVCKHSHSPLTKPFYLLHFTAGTWGHSETKANSLQDPCTHAKSQQVLPLRVFSTWMGLRTSLPRFRGSCKNCELPRPLSMLKPGTAARAGLSAWGDLWGQWQWCCATRQGTGSSLLLQRTPTSPTLQFQQQN